MSALRPVGIWRLTFSTSTNGSAKSAAFIGNLTSKLRISQVSSKRCWNALCCNWDSSNRLQLQMIMFIPVRNHGYSSLPSIMDAAKSCRCHYWNYNYFYSLSLKVNASTICKVGDYVSLVTSENGVHKIITDFYT